MNRIRSALIAGLLLGAAMLLPAERASAHEVFSTWGNVSQSSFFFFFHQNPNLGAFTYGLSAATTGWASGHVAVTTLNVSAKQELRDVHLRLERHMPSSAATAAR